MSINFSGGHVQQYGDVGSCGQYWQNVVNQQIKQYVVSKYNW